jgi:hypothetical protein
MKFWQAECPASHGNKFQQNITSLLDQGCSITLQRVNVRVDRAEEVVASGTTQLGDNLGGRAATIEEAVESLILDGGKRGVFVGPKAAES